MLENKFYKVSHNGGTYVTGLFVNPITWETKLECLRDYDYSDCSRDNDELYYMPIDEEVARLWRRHCGIVGVGDTVEVIKGRKMPIGYIGKVADLRDWRDQFGRVQATYAVFEDGKRTNVDNCRILEE